MNEALKFLLEQLMDSCQRARANYAKEKDAAAAQAGVDKWYHEGQALVEKYYAGVFENYANYLEKIMEAFKK